MSGRCVLKTGIHDPGSYAERTCPEHGHVAAGRIPRAPLAPPQPPYGSNEQPSTMDLGSQEWDEIVRKVGVEFSGDETIYGLDDLAQVLECIDDSDPKITMSRNDFYEAAAAGQRAFSNVRFTGPMDEPETRGMLFSNCSFVSDVVLGDRALLSNCEIAGSLRESSVTEKGGRVAAVVTDCNIGGDAAFSGTSIIAINRCTVHGDMSLRGGNGLQMVAVNEVEVYGLIIMADAGPIVVRNYESGGNVFAYLGSASSLAEREAEARYEGDLPGDNDPPSVHFFSYDDLHESEADDRQEPLFGPGLFSPEHFEEMDRRVIAGGRKLLADLKSAAASGED